MQAYDKVVEMATVKCRVRLWVMLIDILVCEFCMKRTTVTPT